MSFRTVRMRVRVFVRTGQYEEFDWQDEYELPRTLNGEMMCVADATQRLTMWAAGLGPDTSMSILDVRTIERGGLDDDE